MFVITRARIASTTEVNSSPQRLVLAIQKGGRLGPWVLEGSHGEDSGIDVLNVTLYKYGQIYTFNWFQLRTVQTMAPHGLANNT
jgi:hypothetical protein